MKISILTLFPQMFQGPFDYSIINKAIKDKRLDINFTDIRKFGIGKHKIVDDKPYGGGIGMVLKVDVLSKAIEKTIIKNLSKDEQKIILLSASGGKYDQNQARNFSKLKHLILICGHYEGVDERIKSLIDYEVSIGDYVLTGGEIPAMVITDSVARLVNGVLKKEATEMESFSDENTLEHPQYTRPRNFGKLEVPEILLSGNHAKIDQWKKEESVRKTNSVKQNP